MSDCIASGRRFRILNVIDDYSRECPVVEVDTSLGGQRVATVLDRLKGVRQLPEVINVDNGPEFRSKALDEWASHNNVRLSYSRPGKPVDNAFVESFNGRMRDECLNVNWFLNLKHAKQVIEEWRIDYNTVRPHSSLGGLSPVEFLETSGKL